MIDQRKIITVRIEKALFSQLSCSKHRYLSKRFKEDKKKTCYDQETDLNNNHETMKKN